MRQSVLVCSFISLLVVIVYSSRVALDLDPVEPDGQVTLLASQDLLYQIDMTSLNASEFTIRVTHRHIRSPSQFLVFTFETQRFDSGRTSSVWSADPDKYDVIRDNETFTFVVSNLTSSDAGVYAIYEATESVEFVLECFQLKVLFEQPQVATVACGSIVENASCLLNCKTFDFARELFNFTWHFRPKYTSTFTTLHRHTQAVLNLTSVSRDDAGNYTCVTSRQSLNFSAESAPAAVLVVYPATIVSDRMFTINRGGILRDHFDIRSHPTPDSISSPEYKLSMNTKAYENDVTRVYFTLFNIRKNFSLPLVIKNAHFTRNFSLDIRVQMDKPEAPEITSFPCTSSRTIVAEFKPGHDGGLNQTITSQFKVSRSSSANDVSEFINSSTITLGLGEEGLQNITMATNLSDGTMYDLRLVADNKFTKGVAAFSKVTSVRTRGMFIIAQ